jgi:fructose-1-phosphate kinase PfkB-like protein
MVDRYSAHVKSTTGAGDSAMAAIIWSSLKDGDDGLKGPAMAANAAASATISVDPTINPGMSGELIEKIIKDEDIKIRELEEN